MLFPDPLLSAIPPMATFALTGAITPGPVNVLALQHGRTAQRAPALCFVLGASLSYALILAVTGWGMIAQANTHPALVQSARWACAAYLLWLAWRLSRRAGGWSSHGCSTAPSTPITALCQGALAQALNPKAWLFAMSAIGVFVLQGECATMALLGLLCAVSLLACLAGVGMWALAGHLLLGHVTPAWQGRCDQLLALLLALSVIGVVL